MTVQPYTKSGVSLLLDKIPELDQQKFQAIAGRFKAYRWYIGERANYYLALIDEQLLPVTREDVFKVIAILLNQEIKASTIAYYARTEAFYSEPVRIEFDELPFSHFAMAMHYEDWRDLLQFSLDWTHEHAMRPPSARVIEMYASGKLDEIMNEQPPIPDGDFVMTDESIDYDFMSFEDDEPELSGTSLRLLRDIGYKVLRAVDRLPLSGELRDRLSTSVDEMVSVLGEVIAELQD